MASSSSMEEEMGTKLALEMAEQLSEAKLCRAANAASAGALEEDV